ncbi:MAG: hypothetical protein M1820_007194 [Bogoriella megaspora]|nr:MAG: hypothetical protein M1820_007194 [Bogoriella megaspora]
MAQTSGLESSTPLYAHFAADHLTIGAGVAIFHIASSRVVVCYHPVEKYWFLPKGRRDANEDTAAGAVREGFEESGYLNRLLPLPLPHRQPRIRDPADPRYTPFFVEPIWTELVPLSRWGQYLLFWYVAETVPPAVETAISAEQEQLRVARAGQNGENDEIHGVKKVDVPPPYVAAEAFGKDMTLRERIALEPEGYVPVRHPGTGVDSDELLYESHLLTVEEAMKRLKGTVSAEVVRKAWEGIRERMRMESGNGEA